MLISTNEHFVCVCVRVRVRLRQLASSNGVL